MDQDGDGQSTAEERDRFQRELPAPYGIQPWTKANHPDLGEVEVGGSNSKFTRQNPPPELLEDEIRKNVLWAVRKMEWMPLARVAQTRVEKVAGQENIYEVSAWFVNEGRLPTALERAKEIHIVTEDYAEIRVPEGMSLVDESGNPLRGSRGFGRGGGRRPGGMGGPAQAAPTSNRVNMGWLDGSMGKAYKPMRMVSWRVKVEDADSRTITVAIGSTRGGVHRVEVDLPR